MIWMNYIIESPYSSIHPTSNIKILLLIIHGHPKFPIFLKKSRCRSLPGYCRHRFKTRGASALGHADGRLTGCGADAPGHPHGTRLRCIIRAWCHPTHGGAENAASMTHRSYSLIQTDKLGFLWWILNN